MTTIRLLWKTVCSFSA